MGVNDTPAPLPIPGSVGVTVKPLLIEVPILTEADLLELAADIQAEQLAHLRLRSTTRKILRKVRAALDRWSLPPKPPTAAAPTAQPPRLRLVTDGKKKGK